MIDHRRIMTLLGTVPDPEMPISIVDLGLVEDVRVEIASNSDAHVRKAASGDCANVTIDLLPTFIGCPALDMIAGDIRAKVGKVAGVETVNINWLFDPPWSVDRITPAGRESLKAHGVTVPERGHKLNVPGHKAPTAVTLRTSAIPCPFCGSSATHLDSPFGPTRCRTIYYCNACKNSFEHMKNI